MYRFTHSEDRNVQEQPQKRGHVGGVSHPEIHLCAHSSDLYMGQRPDVPGLAKLPNRPPTPTTRTHTRTHTHMHKHSAVVFRTDCVGPHTECCIHRLSVRMKECPIKPKQERWIQECRDGVCVFAFLSFFLFYFQGAKQLLIHTTEQPEYCRFKLHSYEKKVGVPVVFTYIHTYPNNLNLSEDDIQCIVCFTCMDSVASSCLTSLHLLRWTVEVQYD